MSAFPDFCKIDPNLAGRFMWLVFSHKSATIEWNEDECEWEIGVRICGDKVDYMTYSRHMNLEDAIKEIIEKTNHYQKVMEKQAEKNAQ